MWPFEPDAFFSSVKPLETSTDAESWFFPIIRGQLACVVERGAPRPITGSEFRWLELEERGRHYLGRFHQHDCWALDAKGRMPEGYALLDLRGWLGRVEAPLFYLAGRAVQIVDWHVSHQFCGRCGAEMTDHHADRAKVCPECRLMNYPRLSPSIIVLVTRGDEMLLARNANWPDGMYSTLAGFVEPGESIEQTVHREVFEEVGVRVHNLRYLGSQSWPFPNSLMLGFHADYAGGEIVCQEGEIADARWFKHDDLPNVPPASAISRWLIDAFLDSLNKPN